MNGGIIGFIIGAVALLVAFLTGRKTGKEKGEAKANEAVSEARAETAKAEYDRTVAETSKSTIEAVNPIVIESVKQQADAQTEYKVTINNIENARRTNDMDALGKIASDLARKALEFGVKEK